MLPAALLEGSVLWRVLIRWAGTVAAAVTAGWEAMADPVSLGAMALTPQTPDSQVALARMVAQGAKVAMVVTVVQAPLPAWVGELPALACLVRTAWAATAAVVERPVLAAMAVMAVMAMRIRRMAATGAAVAIPAQLVSVVLAGLQALVALAVLLE